VRSNAARLQDIWSMAMIDVIGGTTTPSGRSPSSTLKSSIIAMRSELEGCFVYDICCMCVFYDLGSLTCMVCCLEPVWLCSMASCMFLDMV
jgi:hypothetical protein